ncbi:hypothetical protein EMIT093MI4_60026 [Pseudomonas sp. IT-93MI4]
MLFFAVVWRAGDLPAAHQKNLTYTIPTVGAGLLANALYQSILMWLTHRLREQARSHRGIGGVV